MTATATASPASNEIMPHGSKRRGEKEMVRLKTRLALLFIIVLAFCSCGVGITARNIALAQNRSTNVETAVAVDSARIDGLQKDGVASAARFDVLTAKVDSLSERISNIQGIGTGAVLMLTVLQVVIVIMNVRRGKS